MTIIPINNSTLEIVEALNNGVRPEIEDNKTYFVYKGKDEVPEIVTFDKLAAAPNWRNSAMILFVED